MNSRVATSYMKSIALIFSSGVPLRSQRKIAARLVGQEQRVCRQNDVNLSVEMASVAADYD